MTDTLLANLNNSVSIYCEPLELTHEKIGVKFLRCIERIFLKSFNKRRFNEHIDFYNK